MRWITLNLLATLILIMLASKVSLLVVTMLTTENRCCECFLQVAVSAMGTSISTRESVGRMTATVQFVEAGSFSYFIITIIIITAYNEIKICLQAYMYRYHDVRRCYVNHTNTCIDVRPSTNGAPYSWSCQACRGKIKEEQGE